MIEYRTLDAIMGPGAIVHLLNAFVMAPGGTVVSCGIAQDSDQRTLVMVQVGKGPPVAMTPANARAVAAYCFEVPPPAMRYQVEGLARQLIELADEADAFAPKRLH